MKKSHERFGEIIREHFDTVEPAEFKARLHDASQGAFGEPAVAPRGGASGSTSIVKRAMNRVKRTAAAAAGRVLSILHIH